MSVCHATKLSSPFFEDSQVSLGQTRFVVATSPVPVTGYFIAAPLVVLGATS
jgi:hypothetical protein